MTGRVTTYLAGVDLGLNNQNIFVPIGTIVIYAKKIEKKKSRKCSIYFQIQKLAHMSGSITPVNQDQKSNTHTHPTSPQIQHVHKSNIHATFRTHEL